MYQMRLNNLQYNTVPSKLETVGLESARAAAAFRSRAVALGIVGGSCGLRHVQLPGWQGGRLVVTRMRKVVDRVIARVMGIEMNNCVNKEYNMIKI